MDTQLRTRLRKAAEAIEIAEADFVAAINESRDAGATWAELTEATGLSKTALRWRSGALAKTDYVANRSRTPSEVESDEREAEAERVGAANARQVSAPPGTETVPLATAAKMLKLSRPALYQWIDEGRIPVTLNGTRRAVVVDPETHRIAVKTKGTYSPPK